MPRIASASAAPRRAWRIVLGLLSTGCVLGSVLGWAGEHGWVFDVLASFPVQYALVLSLAACIYAWEERWLVLVPIVAALLANAVLIAPLYLGSPAPAAAHAPRVEVMLLDVSQQSARNPGALIQRLRAAGADASPDAADVVVLQGVTQALLAPLAEAFRGAYRMSSVARDDGFGIAVLAREPVLDSAAVHLVEAPIPAIEVTLARGEERFVVLAVHAPPPASAARARLRDRMLAMIGRWAGGQTAHPIVVGNLNATSWSAPLRQLFDDCRLVTSQVGYGVQATWPRAAWPLRIPVDQVLHGPSLTTVARAVAPFPGSSHHLLRATLARRRPAPTAAPLRLPALPPHSRRPLVPLAPQPPPRPPVAATDSPAGD